MQHNGLVGAHFGLLEIPREHCLEDHAGVGQNLLVAHEILEIEL